MQFDTYQVSTPEKQGVEFIGNIPEKPKISFWKGKLGLVFAFWKKTYPSAGRPHISATCSGDGDILFEISHDGAEPKGIKLSEIIKEYTLMQYRIEMLENRIAVLEKSPAPKDEIKDKEKKS
jgi:hypothetical protein